ncbi:hypothetical protein [Cellulosimicrobium sp. Marseille-Q4280]|uniref:hypothetical protein n=1 Tax=Cellulosimicrobium sp. Marseille-Q4280 TaxID=2937992 RepID=UPI00203D3383|nr:hypothetical protein [Cellulosimicrobium sp. Marseille-Q4280]
MSIFERILAAHRYEVVPDRGVVSGVRPDGSKLSLFRWGNDKHAEAGLIPRAYLVIILPGGRYRLPTVEWSRFAPVDEQARRPASAVMAEFDEVFAPALDLPRSDAHELLAAAGERYDMYADLGRALTAAGLRFSGYHQRRTPVYGPSGTEYRVYGQGRHLVVEPKVEGADVAHLDLTGDLGWGDVQAWLARVVD